jgi:hypothetical protein
LGSNGASTFHAYMQSRGFNVSLAIKVCTHAIILQCLAWCKFTGLGAALTVQARNFLDILHAVHPQLIRTTVMKVRQWCALGPHGVHRAYLLQDFHEFRNQKIKINLTK